MSALSDKIEALMRGGAQGASLGWGDELSPLLMPVPDDGTGIPREYAAGSAYNDAKQTMRRENAEAQDKYPGTYGAGQALGGLPSALATGGSSIPAAGLAAGARGAVEGAGMGNDLKTAAQTAGVSALLGMGGAAAPKALGAIKDMFKGGPPSGGLSPALATAGAAPASRAAKAPLGGPTINKATAAAGTAAPKARKSPLKRAEPKPEAPLPPKVELTPPLDDVITHADENPLSKMHPAMNPPASNEALPEFPKNIRQPTEMTHDLSAARAPLEGMPGESKAAFYGERMPDLQMQINQAQGRPADWHLREPTVRPGQDILDAEALNRQMRSRMPTEIEDLAPSRSSARPTERYDPENYPTGHPKDTSPLEYDLTGGEFELPQISKTIKPGKGVTVKQKTKTPTGVEEESVSVERGSSKKPTDIKKLMKGSLDDDD